MFFVFLGLGLSLNSVFSFVTVCDVITSYASFHPLPLSLCHTNCFAINHPPAPRTLHLISDLSIRAAEFNVSLVRVFVKKTYNEKQLLFYEDSSPGRKKRHDIVSSFRWWWYCRCLSCPPTSLPPFNVSLLHSLSMWCLLFLPSSSLFFFSSSFSSWRRMINYNVYYPVMMMMPLLKCTASRFPPLFSFLAIWDHHDH